MNFDCCWYKDCSVPTINSVSDWKYLVGEEEQHGHEYLSNLLILLIPSWHFQFRINLQVLKFVHNIL